MAIALAMLLIIKRNQKFEKIEPKRSKHKRQRVSTAPSVVAKPPVRRKRIKSTQQDVHHYEVFSRGQKEHVYGSAQKFYT